MSFPTQGYVPTTVPLANLRDSVGSTVLAANQEWFASDFSPTPEDDFASDVVIEFTFENRAIIEVTFDGGTTWYKLNNNNKVEAETLNSFEFPVINTDLVNFRADTAGTLRFARILERV